LVTCACVLEHIPIEDLDQFVSELFRVGKKVYIEIPKPFYDSIYNIPAHLSLCDIADSQLIFISKKNTTLRNVSDFNEYAWKIREKEIFSLDNNPSVTAIVTVLPNNDILPPLRVIF